MFKLVKTSLQDFQVSYKKHLTFAFIYMLLTSLLFVPFISFIFNRMLKAIGTGSLLNAEVYRIGISTAGVAGMLIIIFLTVVLLFIEFGVMIMIAQQTYFKRNILVSAALVTALRKLPALLGFGLVQIMFIFLLIIPFIDSPVFPALLDVNLPIVLTNLFYRTSNFVMFLYGLACLVAIFFFIRWLFTLHYIFIDGKTVWGAMKSSWIATRQNKLKIIINLCILNLLVFVVGFLFLTLLSYLPNLLETMMISQVIQNYLITFSSFITILLSLLSIPINIIIITRLFYRFKENQGELVQDDLTTYKLKRITLFEKKLTQFFATRKYSLVAIVIIYVSSIFFINYTVNDNIVYLKWNAQVAAHRGDLHSAPENSLSSIDAAIEQRVDAVEIDVMLTEDGVIILNHDQTLQRVAGVPDRVEEMTYEEISEIDIGQRFSEEFIGETIPTLDEALDRMREENVTIIIDIKLSDLNRSGEIARGIVELVEKYNLEDAVYVQAFENKPLQEVRQLNSEIKIGQILFLAAGDLGSLDVDFYTIRQTMLTERFVANAHRQNREVWVWTVNIPRNINEVLKYDIDGIITDYPERVQSMIGIDFTLEEE